MASGISLSGALKPGPSDTRLGGGVNPDQALLRNAGTCRPDVKGEARKREVPARARASMRGTGAEQPVVGMKVL